MLIGILVTQFIYNYYLVVDKGSVAEYLGRIWEGPYERKLSCNVRSYKVKEIVLFKLNNYFACKIFTKFFPL